jgi:gamma-glutamylcyclotransferase (GGCT)/AIG2-like uncharacterized protein YtfP
LTIRLFVYGTLAPGYEAWPVLERWVTGMPREDSVAGVLYDTGRGYPAAVFDAAGVVPGGLPGTHGVVHGYVVALDPERAQSALAALDRYEGEEYERVTIHTARDVEAATYAWVAPLHDCRAVAGGRWDRA